MYVRDDVDAYQVLDTYLERRERARLRPADRGAWTTEQAFGEVRALVHGELSGGELWEEWSRVFRAFPAAKLPEVGAYLQQSWGSPKAPVRLPELREAFRYKLLCRQLEVLREEGIHPFSESITLAEVVAWEQEFGLTLPPYFRAFLLSIGAGALLSYEHALFSLGACPRSIPLRPLAERDDMRSMIPELACAIEHLTKHPSQRVIMADALEGREPGPEALESAGSCVTLESFFEGNHGDHEVLLLLSGPRAGHTLYGSDMYHTGGQFMWGRGFVGWLDMTLPDILEKLM